MILTYFPLFQHLWSALIMYTGNGKLTSECSPYIPTVGCSFVIVASLYRVFQSGPDTEIHGIPISPVMLWT